MQSRARLRLGRVEASFAIGCGIDCAAVVALTAAVLMMLMAYQCFAPRMYV